MGRRMVDLPLHPRLAHVVATGRDALSCVVAALVDERDVLRGRPDELPSDLGLRVAVVTGRGRRRPRPTAAPSAGCATMPPTSPAGPASRFDLDLVDPDRAGLALLAGFPDRLAGPAPAGQFQLRTGTGAWVPPGDPLADAPFVVAADLDGKRTSARIRLGAAVDADHLAELLDGVVEDRRLEWDGDELVLRIERRLGALRLGEVRRRPDPGDGHDGRARRPGAIVEAGRPPVDGGDDAAAGPGAAAAGDARRAVAGPVRRRPCCARSTSGWRRTCTGRPAGPTSTASTSACCCGRCCRGRSGPISTASPRPGGICRRAAPPPIDYTTERPTASVRVQDVFGVTEHPTLAGGRVPLTLALLSPADRPIQVTADLPGFWTGSWAAVRKDLAGRYPKHRWPEHPESEHPGRLK